MTVNTTVLLFDPRDERRAVYAEALRSEGLDVIDVADAPAALEAALNALPAIVVASFDSSTSELLTQLSQQPNGDRRAQTATVVLVSAEIGEADVRLANELGCLALTVPPLDGAKLVAAIRGVMAAHDQEPLRASLPQPRSA